MSGRDLQGEAGSMRVQLGKDDGHERKGSQKCWEKNPKKIWFKGSWEKNRNL
jgi:hypothetical protein